MTYTKEFKDEAVHGLRCIEKNGYWISPTQDRIESVRALIKGIGISSSTLYRWDASTFEMPINPDENLKEVINPCVECGKEVSEKLKLKGSYLCEGCYDPHDYPSEVFEESLEKHLDDWNKDIEEERERYRRDELESIVELGREIAQEVFVKEKGDDDMFLKLDNTFFMSMARGLGVKNYRCSEKQLWLKVGLALIKKSGLVETKTIKELRL